MLSDREFDHDAAAPTKKGRREVLMANLGWPAKRDDLKTRLDALKAQQAEAEKIWDSTAAMRAAAESGKVQGFDYPAFFAAADRLDTASKDVKAGATSLDGSECSRSRAVLARVNLVHVDAPAEGLRSAKGSAAVTGRPPSARRPRPLPWPRQPVIG